MKTFVTLLIGIWFGWNIRERLGRFWLAAKDDRQ